MFAFPLVLVAFSGIDASSGLAGQVAIGRRGLRRLIGVRLIAAVVPYVGIALVASSVLPQTGGRWIEAPVIGIVAATDQEWLQYVRRGVRRRDPGQRGAGGDARACRGSATRWP